MKYKFIHFKIFFNFTLFSYKFVTFIDSLFYLINGFDILVSFWVIVKTLESSGEIFWAVSILFVADNCRVKVDVKHVKDIWASIFNKKLAPHKRKMHELSSCPPCVIACDDSISSSQNIFFLMFLYWLVISLVQNH